MKKPKLPLCLTATAALWVLTACGGEDSQPVEDTDESRAPASGVLDRPGADAVRAMDGSAVMAQPMDGSSVEAFEASLARVEAEATADEFRKLKNALGFLLTYDLEVNRSRAALYRKLDGKTPREIIDQMDRVRG